MERIKVETELRHRRITELIEKDHPDLAIVYFDGTDAMGHLLAPDLPRPYFARIDAILGDDRKLAEKTGATLVIASDHGFDWSKPSGKQPADNHRDEGIVLRYPKGPLPHSVIDICPTLLESEPVQVYEHPSSLHASAAPLWVGVKNTFVVTWLTNVKW